MNEMRKLMEAASTLVENENCTSSTVVKQCAKLAAIYFNSATLQSEYEIYEYIIKQMSSPNVSNYIRQELRKQGMTFENIRT